MRWTEIIGEARSNPEHNVQNRAINSIDEIQKYFSDEYFVTFTSVEKVGINPSTEYETPAGIYAYHLGDEAIQKALRERNTGISGKPADNKLPLAGDSPFINIIKPKGGDVLELSAMVVSDKIDRAKHAIKWFLESRGSPATDHTVSNLVRILSNVRPQYHPGYNYSRRPGAEFWTVTRNIAMLCATNYNFKTHGNIDNFFTFYCHDLFTSYMRSVDDPTDERNEDFEFNTESVRNYIGFKGSNVPLLWNKVLRAQGISVVVDDGLGIIHPREPSQALFLSTANIELVERLNNRDSVTRTKKEITTFKRFKGIVDAYVHRERHGAKERLERMLNFLAKGERYPMGDMVSDAVMKDPRHSVEDAYVPDNAPYKDQAVAYVDDVIKSIDGGLDKADDFHDGEAAKKRIKNVCHELRNKNFKRANSIIQSIENDFDVPPQEMWKEIKTFWNSLNPSSMPESDLEAIYQQYPHLK